MIQLRLRTEFSFGATYAPLPRMIERLKAIGCRAAGIVDINSTWGHVPWFKACKEAGIQPLLGVDLIVGDGEETRRMWFLAKNKAGLSELYRLASKANQQPIAAKFGNVARLYTRDVINMTDNIWRFAGDYTDTQFLVDANAALDLSPSSRILNRDKLKIAEKTGLKLVSISDNYFAGPEDKQIYEFASNSRLKATAQHVLETLDHQDMAEEIAASCKDLEFPTAPMIKEDGDLEAICRAGIAFRGLNWTQQYEDRLQYELKLIRSKDFESYFIVVADMVQYAKQHMLVGPSRGSAAGSLVCYTARITEIDPLPPKLFFERFIDVTRTDLPDIDLDFPDNKRQLVFDYMAEKYGTGNVAHIGTVLQFKPRSALIQVCKALNIPPAATYAVKVAMIERGIADSRSNNCLEDTLNETEPGKEFIKQYPQAIVAGKLEGHAQYTGTHAAGLLVCNDRIDNYCTVTADGIAQIDKYSAEKLGLLKIDVLGLRTLGILEDSGVKADWYNMTFDDPEVYRVFNEQRLCSIFQFEGNAMRNLSTNITFKTIKEIDAVTALARPGPFGSGIVQTYIDRHNGKPYDPIHPATAAIMEETYGLPLYQEHTLAIVRDIGRFSWEETSFVRKAISKRQGKEFFQKFWPKFRDGAMSEGMNEEQAAKIWELINAMGAWQMNKSAAEGTLVRITANNSNLPIWCPIEELYKKYVESPSPWVRQKKSMPRLLSLFPDGKGRPQRAKMIYQNGKKPCVSLTFDDGTVIRCSRDHRFIIDGEWKACKKAKIGSKFLSLRRDSDFPLTGRRSGIHNGRHVAMKKFRLEKRGKPCEQCGEKKRRREIHHNDFDMGKIRPLDLAWLCSSCHKLRHKAHGDRGNPFHRGHEQTTKTLVKIKDAGVLQTYDIEMPKHFNYVINGGVVAHNSHTYSYAVISYWTAWLKAHYPLEFAAANLRNASNEDSALELLREMVREGIEFVPLDLELSEMNWSVKNGKLVGGFMALKGIGESKAAAFVESRKNGGLNEKQIEDIKASENLFGEIFPFKARYQDVYDHPARYNIPGDVVKIESLVENMKHGCERIFMGEMIHKNARNANEEVNVKRRNGKLEMDHLDFLDIRLRDDTGMIGARVGRFQYEEYGKDLLEKIPVGAHLLIRAKFWNGIRFAFIQKWRLMEDICRRKQQPTPSSVAN